MGPALGLCVRGNRTFPVFHVLGVSVERKGRKMVTLILDEFQENRIMLLSNFALLLIDFQFKCHVAVLRIREILHKPVSRNEPPLAVEGTEGQLGFLNPRSGESSGKWWQRRPQL